MHSSVATLGNFSNPTVSHYSSDGRQILKTARPTRQMGNGMKTWRLDRYLNAARKEVRSIPLYFGSEGLILGSVRFAWSVEDSEKSTLQALLSLFET